MGFGPRVQPNSPSRSPLESGAIEGDSPVGEGEKADSSRSRVRLVEFPAGIWGSSTSNPKYGSETDSALVP